MEENKQFDVVDVIGNIGLFTTSNIKRRALPKGLFAYDIKKDAEGFPEAVVKTASAGRLGTVLTREPIPLPSRGFAFFQSDDDFMFSGEKMSLDDYVNIEKL